MDPGSGSSPGWAPLVKRALMVAVVGFVVLQGKEYFDAGTFDTPATTVDALLIAGGTFLVDAILKLTKR